MKAEKENRRKILVWAEVSWKNTKQLATHFIYIVMCIYIYKLLQLSKKKFSRMGKDSFHKGSCDGK